LAQDSPRRITPVRVQRKVALVIGNQEYASGRLRNTVADAQSVAAALRELKFDDVMLKLNLGQQDFDRAMDAFTEKLQSGDLALLYYSGHGIQVNRENYLLPVDYKAVSEADVKYRAYSASQARDRLENSGARVRVMILDACRDNPFRSARSTATGLSQMMPQAAGTVIAFATADGQTADDNPAERNGLFTKYLLQSLQTPGLGLDEVFKRTREDVFNASSGKQLPFTYDSLIGQLVLVPQGAPAPAPAPAQPPPASAAAPATAPATKAGRIRVGGTVQSANLVYQPTPAYPPLAKAARITGTVRFTAIIGTDGKVANLELVSGHPLLVNGAMDAVRQWLYKPTMLNGEPVEVITQIDVHFNLTQ
jgi:TonB family protein